MTLNSRSCLAPGYAAAQLFGSCRPLGKNRKPTAWAGVWAPRTTPADGAAVPSNPRRGTAPTAPGVTLVAAAPGAASTAPGVTPLVPSPAPVVEPVPFMAGSYHLEPHYRLGVSRAPGCVALDDVGFDESRAVTYLDNVSGDVAGAARISRAPTLNDDDGSPLAMRTLSKMRLRHRLTPKRASPLPLMTKATFRALCARCICYC